MTQVLLTVEEAAAYLRVSKATVWRWCSLGMLPAFKLGREWRIRKTELDKLTATSQPTINDLPEVDLPNSESNSIKHR